MMFSELNASVYGNTSAFYSTEFEEILSKVLLCYERMISNNVKLRDDENQIRDVLYLNYLNNDVVRKSIGLQNHYFDREIPEDRTVGRTDIRILTPNSFIETSAYYIIECKRLNAVNPKGTTGLNAKYIKNGICRFISKAYSTHYRTNGMIGFVVDTVNIEVNTQSINYLLNTKFSAANTTQELKFRQIVEDFKFSYCSIHNAGKDSVVLYHLMLDLSKQIK